MQRRHIVTLVLGLGLLAAGTATAAVSGTDRASGSLSLSAALTLNSRLGGCAPPGIDACAARTIQGPFPGLGAVNGTYEFHVGLGSTCSGSLGRALSYAIHLPVAGKGEIVVAVAEAPCVDEQSIRNQTQVFAVIGGTGRYVGASGSGTLERVLGEETDTGRYGQERWKGTLSVPGLEFDTTTPTLSGASSKTVRAKKGAKSARVRYQITAEDDQDGTTQVRCTPKSGSRFRIGKTRVTCDAVDLSANAASASFTITVKKGR